MTGIFADGKMSAVAAAPSVVAAEPMTPCHAMVLEQPGGPLVARERPPPVAGPGQILIEVAACGVCRTDLHLLDGELPRSRLADRARPPDRRHACARSATACREPQLGQRVGVPWLGWTCGALPLLPRRRRRISATAPASPATRHRRRLCRAHRVADARYAFRLPEGYGDLAVAPLLCAGLIGYRALRLCGDARRLGLYGFGAAAHICRAGRAVAGQREVYAFTRPGDATAQAFARGLGAALGRRLRRGAAASRSMRRSSSPPPARWCRPRCAQCARAAVVVCGGIHMSDIPSFPYAILWGERQLR